jgi:hypothetical protein
MAAHLWGDGELVEACNTKYGQAQLPTAEHKVILIQHHVFQAPDITVNDWYPSILSKWCACRAAIKRSDAAT